jgi:hypothetical protein
MDYQLFLQMSGELADDLDSLIDLEDRLTEVLTDADVDGHDIGSGQANVFILTTDPHATFLAAKPVLQKADQLDNLIAAYRDADGEAYTVVWPTGSTKVFKIL